MIHYPENGRDGCPSDYGRAYDLVDEFVEAFSVHGEREGLIANHFEHCGLARLSERGRRYLYESLIDFIRIVDDDSILSNIRNAVYHATDLWEIAMVITPYLLSAEDISDSRIIGAIRTRIRCRRALGREL